MNTAEQTLVIILSTALAVLLVLAIAFTISLIKLVKTLQLIALKAESFVDSAEAVGDVMRRTASHLSVARFVKSIIDMVHSKEHKKE